MPASADAEPTSTWELGILHASTFAAAEALATEAVGAAHAAGDVTRHAAAGGLRGLVRVRRGRVGDGLADLGLAATRARRSGHAPSPVVLAGLVDAHLARGDLWSAERLAQPLEAAAHGAPDGLHTALALHALADLASARRDHATAWLTYADAGQALGPLRDDVAVLSWRLGAAVTAVHLGLRGEADALVAEQRRLADADGRDHVLGAALRLAAALGGHASRRALLEQALGHTDAADAPRLAAQVSVDLAAQLVLTDAEPPRAAALLQAAESVCRDERLEPLLVRVEGLLARVRVVPRRRRATRADQLGGLHLVLARMAAEGHTDAEIAACLLLDEAAVRRELAEACRLLGVRTRSRIRPALQMPPPAG